MKIEGDKLSVQTTRSERADRAVDASPMAPGGMPQAPPPPSGDRIELSPEAALARSAMDRAAALPEIRQELVARMRALLDKGELGRDATALADAIIDRSLTTP